MLGSNNSSNGGSADHAAATTAVTEALAAIHVVQAYNLQVRLTSDLHTSTLLLPRPRGSAIGAADAACCCAM